MKISYSKFTDNCNYYYLQIRAEILKTSAFKILNDSGKGEACFDRYTQEVNEVEKISKKSQSIIKAVLSDEEDLKVFWFGSLREFDEKGITLVEEKVVAAPVPKKVIVKKKAKPVKTVDIKTIKIIRRPAPEPKKVKPTKAVIISAFEKAIGRYKKTKKQSLVDMVEFNGNVLT